MPQALPSRDTEYGYNDDVGRPNDDYEEVVARPCDCEYNIKLREKYQI